MMKYLYSFLFLLFYNAAHSQINTKQLTNLYRAPTSADLLKRLKNGVVLITTSKGTGTGFMIGNGFLLTAAHVLKDEITGFVIIELNGIKQKMPYSTSTPINDGGDWILVRLVENALNPMPYTSLPLATYKPNANSYVAMYGGPSLRFSTGKTNVDSRLLITTGLICGPGDSGSPLIDTAGNVVGILTSGLEENCISVNLTRIAAGLSAIPGIKLISKNPFAVVSTTTAITASVISETMVSMARNAKVFFPQTGLNGYFINGNCILASENSFQKGDSVRFSITFQNQNQLKTYIARKISVFSPLSLCILKLETTETFLFTNITSTARNSNVIPVFILPGNTDPVKKGEATVGVLAEGYQLGVLVFDAGINNWVLDENGKITGYIFNDEGGNYVFLDLMPFRNSIINLLLSN